MKQHQKNKKFKKQLSLLAHGRGRRQKLPTRIIPNNKKEILEREIEKEKEEELC